MHPFTLEVLVGDRVADLRRDGRRSPRRSRPAVVVRAWAASLAAVGTRTPGGGHVAPRTALPGGGCPPTP